MYKTRKFNLRASERWQPALLATLAILAVASLLWFRLYALPGGASTTEIKTHSLISVRDISNNPINAPFKLVLYGVERVSRGGLLVIRSVSAGVGFLAAIGFFLIAWRWHTARMAALGTILFVTSSWFLHVSRFANAEVMLFGLVGLVASVLWLKASRDPTFPFFACVVVCGLVLYIPGFIWFIVAGLLWQRSMLALQLRRLNTGYVVLASLFGCALIAPLFWGFIQSPQILKPFFGLPNDFPNALQIAKNLINIALYLFWRGLNNPAQALGRLPILDIFTSAMLGLGVYAYFIRRRLDQTKLLLGIFVIGSLLIALGGPVSITVLIPFVYIVATAGMALLLQQWFTVFPKNPLARSIGASIITIAVLFTSFYHINRYFIAWPNAPATRNAFSIKK